MRIRQRYDNRNTGRAMLLLAWKLQEWDHTPRNVGGFWNLEKVPERNADLLTSLILAQSGPFWTSDLRKCRIINFCCLKPLCQWYFVRAAIGNEYNSIPGFIIFSNPWSSFSYCTFSRSSNLGEKVHFFPFSFFSLMRTFNCMRIHPDFLSFHHN